MKIRQSIIALGTGFAIAVLFQNCAGSNQIDPKDLSSTEAQEPAPAPAPAPTPQPASAPTPAPAPAPAPQPAPAPAPAGTPVNVYRFYDPTFYDHAYSLSSAAPSGYGAEGVSFKVLSSSDAGTLPIYACHAGVFHYINTSDCGGGTVDAELGYIYTSQQSGTNPLYMWATGGLAGLISNGSVGGIEGLYYLATGSLSEGQSDPYLGNQVTLGYTPN